MRPPLAITAGEPAGIGTDLAVMLAARERAVPVVVFADPEVISARANALGVALVLSTSGPAEVARGRLRVHEVRAPAPVVAGALDVANAGHVLACLQAATTAVAKGEMRGLVTGPVSKAVINDAGVAFSGHTEWLRDAAGVPDVVMLLAAGKLRVSLATTHLPLRAVPDALTRELLDRRLRIVLRALEQQFGVASPRLLVSGLNPHAGEGGHLGREEIDVIAPVCDALRNEGAQVIGPLPADTLFTPDMLARGDAVMAMFHDQGLPVLKHAGFGRAVNVTLGLPFVRTSVDHGTALDLAGRGGVDAGSFLEAIRLADELSS